MGTSVGELLAFSIADYILCYFVTTSTINAMSIGDQIYNLCWYQLPRNDQYIVETIIRRAQKTIELKGLGVFVCSLMTYLKVSKS